MEHHSLQDAHSEVLKKLEHLSGGKSETEELSFVKNALRRGWLAPGGWILKQLQDGHMTVAELLKVPPELHQKWFKDLTFMEQATWLDLLRKTMSFVAIAKLLDRTPRRLLQLHKILKIPADQRAAFTTDNERAFRKLFEQFSKQTGIRF